ncbi:alpha-2-macroglobulin family protein, partial [Staphylococcus aureus]
MAHTKDLSFGSLQQKIITQKKLMVQTNIPRFLREGDNLEIVAKISNTGDAEITGTTLLELIDPQTNTPVDGWFQNVFP